MKQLNIGALILIVLMVLLCLLMVSIVQQDQQAQHYEKIISTMIEEDSLSCRFYYVAGQTEATRKSMNLDSLLQLLDDRYDELRPVSEKLSVLLGGKK